MGLDFHFHQLFPGEMSNQANSDLTSGHVAWFCLEEIVPVWASSQTACDSQKLGEMTEII